VASRTLVVVLVVVIVGVAYAERAPGGKPPGGWARLPLPARAGARFCDARDAVRSRSCAAAAAIAACLAAAPGATAQDGVAVMRDCVERRGFVPGDEAAVRARVPARYELMRNSSRAPLLVAQAIRCGDLTVDGVSAPVTFAEVAAVVRSPDGRGCLARAPGVEQAGVDPSTRLEPFDVCNLFIVSWASDHAAFVDWLERDTPDFPAQLVEGFSFELGAVDPATFAAPFRFASAAAVPFELSGAARERSGAIPAGVTFWHPTAGGQVRVRALIEGELGQAEGTLATPPGSELARLMGAEQRPLASGYSQLGGNRWAYGEYHKAVVAD
jgi:hypothetical protein